MPLFVNLAKACLAPQDIILCMAFTNLQRVMHAAKEGFRAFHIEVSRTAANRNWLLSLERAQWLALIHETDIGLDAEDANTLVKLAFQSFENKKQRERLITRLSKHLQRRPDFGSSD